MRIFTCFSIEPGLDVPALALVVAEDEHHALDLARRELGSDQTLEIYEGRTLILTDLATSAAEAQAAEQAGGAGSADRRSGSQPDALLKVISDAKIWRYGGALADAADPDQRAALQSLLLEEKRFGVSAERLETVQGLVAEIEERMAAQRQRVQELKDQGQETEPAEQLLQQLALTSEFLARYAREIQQALAAGRR